MIYFWTFVQDCRETEETGTQTRQASRHEQKRRKEKRRKTQKGEIFIFNTYNNHPFSLTSLPGRNRRQLRIFCTKIEMITSRRWRRRCRNHLQKTKTKIKQKGKRKRKRCAIQKWRCERREAKSERRKNEGAEWYGGAARGPEVSKIAKNTQIYLIKTILANRNQNQNKIRLYSYIMGSLEFDQSQSKKG